MLYYQHQVIPFGNLRIKVYLPLPEAYRSLSRPSSPFSTKASTVCPLKLDFLRILLFSILVLLREQEVLISLSIDQQNLPYSFVLWFEYFPRTYFWSKLYFWFITKSLEKLFFFEIITDLHVDVKERPWRFVFSLSVVCCCFFNFFWHRMVGLIGLEPMTPALSRRCSNQLSYRPRCLSKCWNSETLKRWNFIFSILAF